MVPALAACALRTKGAASPATSGTAASVDECRRNCLLLTDLAFPALFLGSTANASSQVHLGFRVPETLPPPSMRLAIESDGRVASPSCPLRERYRRLAADVNLSCRQA